MATAIIMPKAGMAMEEGTVVKWMKAEGEPVEKGEPLLEILTDKVNMEVEAQVSGTLIKILKKEGEAVPVTQTIGYIGERGEKVEETENAGTKTKQEEKKKEAPKTADPEQVKLVSATGKVAATPAARRIAAEKNIELTKVKATGAYGEIKERDVLSYQGIVISPLAKRAAEANGIDPSTVSGSGYNGKVLMQDIASKLEADTPAESEASAATPATQGSAAGQITADGKEILEEEPYSGIRKIIGDRLAQSKFTAPHLYFTQKVNLDKLLEVRKQINEAQEKKTSVTDYIARATIKALQKYPDLNESLVGDNIVKYKSINLGIAVAAPGGLIVPVVKNANQKTVVELSKEASALFEKARTGKLKPDEYTGGTFTISNLGMFGIENFTAIINPPEVGILAVSATKDEPLVVADEKGEKTIKIKPMMNITLTVDHRVIDGLLAAQFVTEIKRLLENPIELMI